MGHTRSWVKADEDQTAMQYHMPTGVHAISAELLDLRADSEVDQYLLSARPVSDERNVWFYWHSGFAQMQVCLDRKRRPKEHVAKLSSSNGIASLLILMVP